MSKEIIVAVVSVLGTVLGSFGGIITSSKLTSFRLDKLEQKVDEHDSFAEKVPVLEEKISDLDKRVDHFERRSKYED